MSPAIRRSVSRVAFLLLVSGAAAACAAPSAPEAPAKTGVGEPLFYMGSPELSASSRTRVVALWDRAEGRPRRVSGDFVSAGVDEEQAARAFLGRHAGLFRLREDGRDLEMFHRREGLAGSYLRFRQVAPAAGGSGAARALLVFDGQVVVLVRREGGQLHVRGANLAHRGWPAELERHAGVGESAAVAAARAAVGAPMEDGEPEVELGIGGEPAQLTYRVQVSAVEPRAVWDVRVSAADGRVLSVRDRVSRADGTGYVFDPSPNGSTGMNGFVDNGDATTPELDAARFLVVLPNLDGSGFVRGTWVDARTKNANNRAVSASLTFERTRAEVGFEEVNAYFHLDRTQARLQSLGIRGANASMQEVIADGQQGDNSYFDPAKDVINCGQGGVDDAEDSDIVIHEYGHAIQEDQVPGYGAGGDAGAMGEGFGDYLAASMNRLLSQQVIDPACIAEWDAVTYAMGDPPCLRRVDGARHFPEHAFGEVHDDGEMWSSALFDLETTFGADVMNRLVLEAHFSQASTESFFGASQSLLDTDALLFGGAHQDAIRRRLIQQGLSRILSAPAALGKVQMSIDVSIENPLSGGEYTEMEDDTQSFSYPGALGLRLHFTKVDTELDATCLAGACDNVYLTGKEGDLYQILSGQQTNVLSVVIPGDTVNIRLVSDGGVGLTGYHVDRVDVMEEGVGGSGGAGGTGGWGGSGGAGTGGMGGSGGAGTGGMGGSGGGGVGASGGGMSGPGGMGAGAAGGGDGGTGAVGGADGGAGGAGGDGDSSEPGGCGCRVEGRSSSDSGSGAALLGLALTAALGARRRRSGRAARD